MLQFGCGSILWKRKTSLPISAVHQPFCISICIWTLPMQHSIVHKMQHNIVYACTCWQLHVSDVYLYIYIYSIIYLRTVRTSIFLLSFDMVTVCTTVQYVLWCITCACQIINYTVVENTDELMKHWWTNNSCSQLLEQEKAIIDRTYQNIESWCTANKAQYGKWSLMFLSDKGPIRLKR